MSGGNFDVDAAIAHLNSHAGATSHGRCAAYVRQALAAGGIEIERTEATRYAKDYGSILLAHGFSEASVDSLISPKKGDISVIQPYPGGNIAGHITMYNGHQWVSDFRQKDMWRGPGYRENKPAYKVYRWSSNR
ncbi:hypothetical protein [Paraburkholderia adhaesiva]|uniref:hypothetical protein n=1 Tax=Paraburkholderia adhaesiva TaxID=2883244 RepID=UPI001F3E357E|nr:hypothetical protein [Paraburkholderia adhaesiva]